MSQVQHQDQRPNQKYGADGCCKRTKATLPCLSLPVRCADPCLPYSLRRLWWRGAHLVLLRPITALEEALLYPCQRLSHLSTRGVHATQILDEPLVLLIHLFRYQLICICHNTVLSPLVLLVDRP